MARRRKYVRWLRQAGITILVVAGIVLVAEWVARGFQDKLLDPKTHPMFAFDPLLGHTFKPYLAMDLESPAGERVVIDINSMGLRDRQVGARARGGVRIVGLGDAMTAATFVPQGGTYLRVLEKNLDAADPQGSTYRVVNAAVNGYGLQQSHDLLLKMGETLDPDVVLIGLYIGDDIQDYGRKQGLPVPGKSFWRAHSYLYHLLKRGYHGLRGLGRSRPAEEKPDRLPEWRDVFARYGEVPEDDPILRYVEESRREFGLYRPGGVRAEAWSSTKAVLEGIQDLSGALGAKTLLVLLPTKLQVVSAEREKAATLVGLSEANLRMERPQDELLRMAAELELPVVDLLDDFRCAPSPDSLYFPRSRFWNRQGHLVAAEVIGHMLKSGGILESPAPATESLPTPR